MKYLLWLALIAVIWWVWSKRKRVADVPPPQAASPAAESMVNCAHCGVYLPESDSIAEDGLAYCCEAHRALGRSVNRR